MESGDTLSINNEPLNRRMTRQSIKEHGSQAKLRERRKRRNAEAGGVTAVNGSETQERSTDDNEEPSKKKRNIQSTEDKDADADMEVQVDGNDSESDDDEEMNLGDPQPAKLIMDVRVHLEPLEAGAILRCRRSIHSTNADSGMDTEAIKHSTGSSKRDSGASVIPTRQTSKQNSRTESQTVKRSMEEYHRNLLKGQSGSSKRDSGASVIPTRQAPKQHSRTEGQTMKSSMEYHRNLQKGLSDHAKFASANLKVMDLSQTSNSLHSKKASKKGGVSSRIFMGILWLFLLCAFFSIGVLAYQRIPWSSLRSRSTSLLWPMAPADSVGVFSDHMRALEQHFQSQRNELWRRSHIHLQRHLQTAEHTEPVTVILAAGRRAEGTLRCLAVRLASAFSSAVNGSVLEMDGATMADKDSNQVKLDLDNQLRGAFDGDKQAAIIHRLEELPPSSTLIFYRYCDHENAAYKHPLLAFTVLLPQDEVGPEVSLQKVEEMVHDHVQQKFLVPGQPDTFDKMDVDKLSGLWSRISHLVLPVSMEQHIEEGGCDRS